MAAVSVAPVLGVVALAAVLGGCADPKPGSSPATLPTDAAITPPPQPAVSGPRRTDAGATSYLCDGGTAFTVRDEGDFVLLRGLPGGEERLGRDAGGLTPAQTVYSSATLRAEFGLGPDGRDALLHELASATDLRCRRD